MAGGKQNLRAVQKRKKHEGGIGSLASGKVKKERLGEVLPYGGTEKKKMSANRKGRRYVLKHDSLLQRKAGKKGQLGEEETQHEVLRKRKKLTEKGGLTRSYTGC